MNNLKDLSGGDRVSPLAKVWWGQCDDVKGCPPQCGEIFTENVRSKKPGDKEEQQ